MDQPKEKTDLRLVEGDVRRSVVRAGILTILGGIAALAGLVISFSSDPTVKASGWDLFRYGLLAVFFLLNYIAIRVAWWSWKRMGMISWWLGFVLSLILTAGAVAALFAGRPDLAEGAYYLAIVVFVIALAVSVREDRQRRKDIAGQATQFRPP